jgi:diguanylate cyclase (GGDEF)-like protein/PAS domain S-box-containing protein
VSDAGRSSTWDGVALGAIPQPHVLLEPIRDAAGRITDFEFKAANEAACEINNVSMGELIGRRLLDLHPNVEGAGLFEKYVAVIEAQEPFELVDWGYPQERLGGQWRYYDVHAVASQGCVSQTWTDVTDRHEALAKLADSERRYRLLAENASDVVFLGSNEGVLQWVSPRTRDIVGWEPRELTGRPFREFVCDEDQATLLAAQANLLVGRASKLRLRLKTSDGSLRWVAITAKPLFGDDGTVIGRAGSWTDIADVVAAREVAEAKSAQVRAMLDAQIDPFILLGAVRDDSGEISDLEYLEANDTAVVYNQATREELIGSRLLDIYPGLRENGPFDDYVGTIETGEPTVLDEYAYPNEVLGGERRYDIRAVKCGDAIALTWRDVTDRYRAVEQLADSERRYRLLAQNATDVIWDVTEDGCVEWASESTSHVLGWAIEHVLGHQAREFVHPEDVAFAMAAADELSRSEAVHLQLRVRRADGTYGWFALAARSERTSGGRSRILALRDIDAEMAARADLAGRVGRDPLTGLITRERLERRLAEEMVTRGPDQVALLCVGLDSLSRVNDAYTHAAGDLVVVSMAERMLEEIGDVARVARGTGAEFLVWIPVVSGASDVGPVAERLRKVAREPIAVGERSLTMTVSIGVADGATATTPSELVRAATLAMRAAKDNGRDQIAFSTQDLAHSAQQWLLLSEAVTMGLRKREFETWLQPIHDLSHGELCGFEALARWRRGDGGVTGPLGFLPVAEQSELITEIDIAMMQQSLILMAAMDEPVFVSLNVSARSLGASRYEAALVEVLNSVGIEPQRIHLEVTETDLLEVSDDVVARMHRIAEMGMGWYIDDFGTGYSSISHLRDLPVRGLKLDTSFSAGIQSADPRSIRLAQALAGLAQGLGLDTIAEGVETDQQRAILSAQGWRYGQGWLFGEPAPLAA